MSPNFSDFKTYIFDGKNDFPTFCSTIYASILTGISGSEIISWPVLLDILDILHIVNIIMEFSNYNDEELCRADINQDNVIDIFDIIIMINLILDN